MPHREADEVNVVLVLDQNQNLFFQEVETIEKKGDEPPPKGTAEIEKFEVWTGKNKARSKGYVKKDEKATQVFIGLVKSHYMDLNSNKKKKKDVFQEIADIMMKDPHNYDLGDKPGVKCSQKWDNLQRSYKDHIKACDQTGQGADILDNAPSFFKELHSFLGETHAAFPQFVGDSFEKNQNPTSMANKRKKEGQKKTKGKEQRSSRPDDEGEVSTPPPSDQSESEDEDPADVDLKTDSKNRKLRPSKATKFDKMVGMIRESDKKLFQLLEEKTRNKEAESKRKEDFKRQKHEDNIRLQETNMQLQQKVLEALIASQNPKPKKKKSSKNKRKDRDLSSDEDSSN